jgi:hypothetical protein
MANITPDDAPILPCRTNQMPDGIFGRDRIGCWVSGYWPALTFGGRFSFLISVRQKSVGASLIHGFVMWVGYSVCFREPLLPQPAKLRLLF